MSYQKTSKIQNTKDLTNLKNGIRSGSANLNTVYTAMDKLLAAYDKCMKSVLAKEER